MAGAMASHIRERRPAASARSVGRQRRLGASARSDVQHRSPRASARSVGPEHRPASRAVRVPCPFVRVLWAPERALWASVRAHVHLCVDVCICACACASVRVRLCACACICAWAWASMRVRLFKCKFMRNMALVCSSYGHLPHSYHKNSHLAQLGSCGALAHEVPLLQSLITWKTQGVLESRSRVVRAFAHVESTRNPASDEPGPVSWSGPGRER